jgi:hypothetical protein
MIDTALNRSIANADGYAAFGENRPAAPGVSATVMALIGDAKVGTGAVGLFKAFTAGYEQARDDYIATLEI